MNLIDQIAQQTSLLPREAQIEVLDFVGYLVSKYAAEAPSEDEAWDQVSARELREAGAPAPTRSR